MVASDLEVHHEVAGGCAVYAQPMQPQALARAVVEVVAWSEDRRARHREAAVRRVAELRQDDPIARHVEVYERVLEDREGRARG